MRPPELSTEQRKDALRQALDARRLRATFRAELKSGSVTPADGFERALADRTLGRMRISEFLSSLPRWGELRTDDFMEHHALTANRRLTGLGRQQVDTIRAALR